MYIAFVNLVMKFWACAFLQHSKGNLLYSTATTQSMIDYLPKALEDGIVDTPSSHGVVL